MIGSFPGYRFNLSPSGYQNFVLDNLAAIESKAGKVAKKLGVSIEKLYNSIGFDPIHFQFSGGIRHDYAKNVVIDMLEDENKITRNMSGGGGGSSLSSTEENEKPRLAYRLRKLATLGILAAGGLSIYSGISDLANNDVSPITLHPKEYFVYRTLDEMYLSPTILIDSLDPMDSYFDLDGAKSSVDGMSSNYKKISHIVDVPNNIEESLKKLESGIPSSSSYSLEEGDIFSDERKVAGEMNSEIFRLSKHYEAIAYADQNFLQAVAVSKIVPGLVVSPIMAYVVWKKLAGE